MTPLKVWPNAARGCNHQSSWIVQDVTSLVSTVVLTINHLRLAADVTLLEIICRSAYTLRCVEHLIISLFTSLIPFLTTLLIDYLTSPRFGEPVNFSPIVEHGGCDFARMHSAHYSVSHKFMVSNHFSYFVTQTLK